MGPWSERPLRQYTYGSNPIGGWGICLKLNLSPKMHLLYENYPSPHLRKISHQFVSKFPEKNCPNISTKAKLIICACDLFQLCVQLIKAFVSFIQYFGLLNSTVTKNSSFLTNDNVFFTCLQFEIHYEFNSSKDATDIFDVIIHTNKVCFLCDFNCSSYSSSQLLTLFLTGIFFNSIWLIHEHNFYSEWFWMSYQHWNGRVKYLFVILSTMPDKTFEFVFSKLTLTDWF